MTLADALPLLSYTDAALLVSRHCDELRLGFAREQEALPLLDALGRVLASPVVADRDQPPFRRSTRDGFACRSKDIQPGDAQEPLNVVGQIRAGGPAALSWSSVERGQAVEIMTGAPVPEGADCVVMVEHVTRDLEAGTVAVEAGRYLKPGENIVAAGAEAVAGTEVLAAGVRLAANHMGAAAACGYAQVAVYRRPRIAVLATGDELVELGATLLPFQIRNSNSYSLAAQIASAGAEPVRLPVAPDDPAAIEAAIRAALSCDLVVLSGGVSAGRYDFVEAALAKVGAEFLFTGVLMQPGRPVVFGRAAGGEGMRYFFGLPGNPVSTLVTFALFVRPLLDALAGVSEPAPRFLQARLGAEVKVKPGLTRFLPATLSSASALGSEVVMVPWQGSGDLAAAAKANCYLVVPPECERLGAGEMVTVLLD